MDGVQRKRGIPSFLLHFEHTEDPGPSRSLSHEPLSDNTSDDQFHRQQGAENKSNRSVSLSNFLTELQKMQMFKLLPAADLLQIARRSRSNSISSSKGWRRLTKGNTEANSLTDLLQIVSIRRSNSEKK